ncbi:NapH [Denitrovibrio acetiphilus DSM 12809]|uniref:NapH n=1 Tax=Denitrovibrio acetiphilus (strain DSM 12809 / NBRC 114555 / N2460) TaxID=522772 RepID=D4H1E7_DENA2|nr:4Fe-4S binding protein [Denitrovibrio acetiphilus]ADD66895.1 NapH [Denitrovibrio acetiphilus DSM 12809]
MKIKTLRHTAQTATLIAIFVIPFMNVWELYFIKGTFYSMDIGDAAIADPLAVFQSMLASRIINIHMLASVVIPIALMILLGRVWCSWFCPYYFFTEWVEFCKKKLGLKLRKPSYSAAYPSKASRFRFIFLLIGFLVMAVIGVPVLNLISAPGIISSQALVVVKFGYVTFELLIVFVILFLELFYYRYWCRLFCPTGTFLSLFRNKHGMTVRKVTDTCSMCGSCIKACPAVINPMTEGGSLHCHNCGDCIDICPDNKKRDTLKFTFR